MTGLQYRRAEPADDAQILGLAAQSLGWVPDDLHRSFFEWKHRENPFGVSPMWVATEGERVVGFRTFLRWEFLREGEIIRAVRAVDTATHPDYQGRGIFRTLTMQALEELKAEGVAFVFNTPNDQSRPGYLKMGWVELGRVPVSFRPASIGSIARLIRARVPADMWSEPIDAGRPFVSAELTGGRTPPAPHRVHTNRSPAYLGWRYGFGPLRYRLLGDDHVTVFRVRRRGAAREVAICDHFGEWGATRHLARSVGADYAIRVGTQGQGFVQLPRQGPILTWRAVADGEQPSGDDLELSLGDVELF